MAFTWRHEKGELNIRKHRLDFSIAQQILPDPQVARLDTIEAAFGDSADIPELNADPRANVPRRKVRQQRPAEARPAR